MNTSLKEGIDWVGYVDWIVRDFHGYMTDKGSTYNAYLVRDEKIALIDTVKAPYAKTLLDNVRALTALEKVDYIVCNHAEPDHSGGLPEVVKALPNATVVCNEKCQVALGRHFDTSTWKFQVVKDGEQLSLGKRSLMFLDTPMVHWPESMFTYVPEEKVLFSMDAFGQHLATSRRFDDELEDALEVIMPEATTYYANIVMPYGKQVQKVLDRAATIAIEVIAPSHGVIWRKHIPEIVAAYRDFAVCRSKRKVVIVFDSMWKSTELMAHAIADGASLTDVEVKLYSIRASNLTLLATEALDGATFAFGTPTLNQGMMPEISALLTYLKGLRPTGKAAFAFGSYGWAKGGSEAVEAILKDMKMEILRPVLNSQYVPTEEILKECFEAGQMLAQKAQEMTKTA
ncbi:TPA: MBL fold metallo-hydrolase [Candidatus Sumerlaeota bacterium]|nr:MBL fold metallo-hydrolase [Candidatus Sumerlaeota bacterium]